MACAALVSSAAAPREDALGVLDKYIQYSGGRDKIEKIATACVKASVKEGNQDLDVELQLQIPDKVLFLLTAPNGMAISMGFTGEGTGWRNEGQGSRSFEGEMASGMYRFFLGLMPQAFLRLQTNSCLDQAVVERNGETVTLKLPPNSGKPMVMQFSAINGALMAVDKHRFSDFRDVDGIPVPFSLKEQNGFGFAIKEIRWNAVLKESDFKSDAWIKPASTPEEQYRTLLSQPGKLEIVRKPVPMAFQKNPMQALPRYDVKKGSAFSVDLRGSDCSSLELGKEQMNDLLHASFDSKTKWPVSLPEGFDPKRQMDLGISPGLKVRLLHQKGVTGKGIGIGIIDQTLLVDHREYCDRLKLYEEIHNASDPACAMMHGPAVASIAVGRSVGVAPEADLYYIAETHGNSGGQGKFDWDFTWTAKCIDRLLEVNKTLPESNKIRVISISVGWSKGQKGYAEANEAVRRAAADNVFVITTGVQETHKLYFHGLGRQPYDDPEETGSYTAGAWWAERFFSGKWSIDAGRYLLAPMDSRCVASPSGPEDYVFYAEGGWSWSVPYIAGLYALSCQVDSQVTPEVFWTTAIKTGDTVTVEHEGKQHRLGSIANPSALIEAIRKK
jgi:hypothetical protein